MAMFSRLKTAKFFLYILAVAPLLFAHATIQTSHAAAPMDKYIKKYKGVKVPEPNVVKLAEYHVYIKYFTDFSFFKPRHKVSPNFIKALILAESNADPQATSYKNARGLTQILHETGKRAAKELYNRKINFDHVSRATLKDLQPDDLYNPAINILLACYLISKYNFDFNGQLELVVSAWNAGRNSITDDMKPPNYQETLNLIGKINGYFIYLIDNQKEYGPSKPNK